MSQVQIKTSSTLLQKEVEKTTREQAEAEANAREIRLKMQEHQQRFTCHIVGCKNTSAGPMLKEYGGHWLWDWHQPTELALCDHCFSWTCTFHLYSGICQDCLAKMK
jgi:hypothetical protein